MNDDFWADAKSQIDAIYRAVEHLENAFPGRKFTPDGHLVGSIGEVAAAYMFDLQLNPASTLGFDARTRCGKEVEIKLTQAKSVSLRHQPQYLIALRRAKGQKIEVLYNGPGSLVWEHAGAMQKNGQRPIGVSKLKSLQSQVTPPNRIRQVRTLDI